MGTLNWSDFKHVAYKLYFSFPSENDENTGWKRDSWTSNSNIKGLSVAWCDTIVKNKYI